MSWTRNSLKVQVVWILNQLKMRGQLQSAMSWVCKLIKLPYNVNQIECFWKALLCSVCIIIFMFSVLFVRLYKTILVTTVVYFFK